jgi:hypothetical protein
MKNDNDQSDDGSVDDLSNSRYLKQADVGDGVAATIRTVVKENIAARDQEPELGRVVFFHELEKGLVLNKTKGEQIAAIAGSRKFRHWRGVRVELWADPRVTMKGRVTGGIRVRPPKAQRQPHTPVGIHESSADLDRLNAELQADVAALTR